MSETPEVHRVDQKREKEIPERVKEARQLEQQREREQKSKRRSLDDVFRPLGSKGWHTSPPPPRPALIQFPRSGDRDPTPWLLRGKVGMLAAPGGAGKSQALIQLALCIASNNPDRKWLGFLEIPEESRGPVVLALGEEGEDDTHARIHRVLASWGLLDDDLTPMEADELRAIARNLYAMGMAEKTTALMQQPVPVWRVDDVVSQTLATQGFDVEHAAGDEYLQARTDTRQRLLEGWAEQSEEWADLLDRPPGPNGEPAPQPWRAIILDPAAQFIGPDVESDNAAATRFVQLLQSWAVKRWGGADYGPSVLFAHHVSKGSIKGEWREFLSNSGAARGSSALTDGARWQANMISVPGALGYSAEPFDVVALQVNKCNDGARGGVLYTRRDPDTGILRHALPDDAERWIAQADDGERTEIDAASAARSGAFDDE